VGFVAVAVAVAVAGEGEGDGDGDGAPDGARQRVAFMTQA
jgi:hypothetical protein